MPTKQRCFRVSTALLSLLSTVVSAADNLPQVADSDCDCFQTNGSTPAYFTSHRFFDFRSLSQYVEGNGSGPVPLDDARSAAEASVTSPYFHTDEWAQTWGLQNWNNSSSRDEDDEDSPPFLMVNSFNNVFIQLDSSSSPPSTHLTLRTHRPNRNLQTTAEFESLPLYLSSTSPHPYLHLSLRMSARVSGAPGAVAAMFTYRGSSGSSGESEAEADDDVQESDLEILTKGPRDRISYTNQPSYFSFSDEEVPEATRNASMEGGGGGGEAQEEERGWDEWATHRMDWTAVAASAGQEEEEEEEEEEEGKGGVVWYVDGEETAAIKSQTPTKGCKVHFNMWGDGGSWSGRMGLGEEARMEVRWIEMVYNTTADADNGDDDDDDDDKGQCKRVCSIDETSEAGQVVLLSEAAAYAKSGCGGLSWAASLMVAFFLLVVR